jgi:hypothetical protein
MTKLTTLVAIALLAFGPTASAAERRLRLDVFGMCPNVTELRVELARLLPDLIVKPNFQDAPTMAVGDIGARYIVSYGKNKVDLEDASRNCDERARTAAVFVATLLSPPKIGNTLRAPHEKPPLPSESAAIDQAEPSLPVAPAPPQVVAPPPAPEKVIVVPAAPSPPSKPASPPSTLLRKLPKPHRWYKDFAGDALALVGVAALGTGIGFLVDYSRTSSMQNDNYSNFAAARGASWERATGAALTATGGALLVAATIRYVYVARSSRMLAKIESGHIGWTF